MSETYADRQALWEKWTAGERLAYGCGHRDGRAAASTSWCETCQHPFHFGFFLIPKAARSDREPVLGGVPPERHAARAGARRMTEDRVLTLSETARLLRLTESQVPLTVRQHEVMQLMANGHGLAEIGHRLGISRWTVKEHLRAAIFRLDARNREDAVRLYTLAHPELVA